MEMIYNWKHLRRQNSLSYLYYIFNDKQKIIIQS